MVILPALADLPGAATEKLCSDYLAQGDERAGTFGPPQFEEAAKTLLTLRPDTAAAPASAPRRTRAFSTGPWKSSTMKLANATTAAPVRQGKVTDRAAPMQQASAKAPAQKRPASSGGSAHTPSSRLSLPNCVTMLP